MAQAFSTLIPNDKIRSRITELAAEISADYSSSTEEHPVLLLCTLRGAAFFAADLVRALTIPCELDFIKVHSYFDDVNPAGIPVFELGREISVAGRDVLIIEDIVDTGQTMDLVKRHYTEHGANSVKIASLLNKPSRRLPGLKNMVDPDYSGFEIPDLFVVGWGLDFNEKYRLLPDVMVYDPKAE